MDSEWGRVIRYFNIFVNYRVYFVWGGVIIRNKISRRVVFGVGYFERIMDIIKEVLWLVYDGSLNKSILFC